MELMGSSLARTTKSTEYEIYSPDKMYLKNIKLGIKK